MLGSAAFTWFHIYLALKMMFYPIDFLGCCQVDCADCRASWMP